MCQVGSTNTGWHIDVHHVKKLYIHEVNLNIMGILEWGIYGLMGWAFMTMGGEFMTMVGAFMAR